MASQFGPPVFPRLSIRKGSASDVGNGDDSEIYDDVVHVKPQFSQKVPPPVATKPRTPPTVINQTLYDDIAPTKENVTNSSQKVPPPVAAKSKQHMSPVTKPRSNLSNSGTLSIKEITTKSLQNIRPPIATKPKQNTPPVTEQRNGSLYSNTVSTKQTMTQPSVAAQSTQPSLSIAEEENSLYDDTVSVKKTMIQISIPPVAPKLKKYVNTEPQKVCKMAELTTMTLPCLIQITSGCCGNKIVPMANLSEGEELIVFFTKTSTVVPAYKPGKKAKIYHIPLCSAFEFGLINGHSDGANCNFDSITDMLSRTTGLPKVVKVLKSCIGKTKESSVSAGTLIFPKRIVTNAENKGKTELQCTSSDDKTLTLKLPCVGNFSIHPSDVKMSIPQYISYINKFPATVQVFNYNKSHKESYIRMGSQLILTNPITVTSFICTKDIFGENDYPLLEVPMEAPVLVKCTKERVDVNMSSLLDKARLLYDNFSLSMIENYVVCEESCFEIQSELYKEIISEISNPYYKLSYPAEEHDYECVEVECITPKSPVPCIPKRSGFSSPPRNTSHDCPSKMVQATERMSSLPGQPEAIEERNKAYLQSLSRVEILQLLDNMNLSQHKASFQEEQVDGMIMVELTNDDLKELGVTKGIQQKRLLCLINGSMSAKSLLENNSEPADSVYY